MAITGKLYDYTPAWDSYPSSLQAIIAAPFQGPVLPDMDKYINQELEQDRLRQQVAQEQQQYEANKDSLSRESDFRNEIERIVNDPTITPDTREELAKEAMFKYGGMKDIMTTIQNDQDLKRRAASDLRADKRLQIQEDRWNWTQSKPDKPKQPKPEKEITVVSPDGMPKNIKSSEANMYYEQGYKPISLIKKEKDDDIVASWMKGETSKPEAAAPNTPAQRNTTGVKGMQMTAPAEPKTPDEARRMGYRVQTNSAGKIRAVKGSSVINF